MPKRLPKIQEFEIDSFKEFSNIQLVALDLDGTLLNFYDRVLPEKFLKLTRRLNHPACGMVRITIATGRTLSGVKNLLDSLQILKDTPIILYNGSVILNKKYNLLYKKDISVESFRKIFEISSQYKVKVIAYTCKWVLQEGLSEYAYGWSSLDKPNYEYNNMPVEWHDWNDFVVKDDPSAIVIHTAGDSETVKCMGRELRKIKDISCSHGGLDYIEVRPKETNKGVALKRAAEILRMSKDHVLAIGDNDNDIEMLSWAGIGVSIDKASTRAIKSSKYITDSGVFNGAIEVLQLLREARRLRGREEPID